MGAYSFGGVGGGLGGATALSDVLGIGNTTGGTDLQVSDADSILLGDGELIVFGDVADASMGWIGASNHLNISGLVNAAAGIKVATTLVVTGITTLSDDVKVAAAKKIYLDGGTETYIDEVSSDTLTVVVGGVLGLTLAESTTVTATFSGALIAQSTLAVTGIITSTEDINLAATKKLYLDGGTETYLEETSSDVLGITVGGVSAMTLTESTTVTVNFTGPVTAASTLGITGVVTASEDINLAATKKLYFDGGVETYIEETSTDVMSVAVGGVVGLTLTESTTVTAAFSGPVTAASTLGITGIVTASEDINLAATKKLYLDGGTETYIEETSSDVLGITVGGVSAMTMTESTTVTVNFTGPLTAASTLGVTGITTLAATVINGAISGTGTLTRTLMIGAESFTPSTTTPCQGPFLVEYGTNDVDVWALRFPDGADSYGFVRVTMPDGWNGGTVTAEVEWTPTVGGGSASAETVAFDIDMISQGNDEAIDVAFGAAVQIDDVVLSTVLDIHHSPVSGAITAAGTPAGGETLVIRIMRDESQSNIVGGIDVLSVKIRYVATVSD